jgi:hypothetical protein
MLGYETSASEPACTRVEFGGLASIILGPVALISFRFTAQYCSTAAQAACTYGTARTRAHACMFHNHTRLRTPALRDYHTLIMIFKINDIGFCLVLLGSE